jgi:hypothetical protein
LRKICRDKRDEEKVFGEEKGLEKYFEIKRDEEK